MKVTKREPTEVKQTIEFDDIEPGTVFEYEDGVIALKLYKNNALLLDFGEPVPEPWFELALAYRTVPIKKIHGKLVEVVVD